MGTSGKNIQKIFLSEGLLLGVIGTALGFLLALVLCIIQLKFRLVKIEGGSFLIDYFPVKIIVSDLLLVGATAIAISFLAAWFPARKASRQGIELNR